MLHRVLVYLRRQPVQLPRLLSPQQPLDGALQIGKGQDAPLLVVFLQVFHCVGLLHVHTSRIVMLKRSCMSLRLMMYFCVRVARLFTSSTTGSQRTSLVLEPSSCRMLQCTCSS